MQGLAVVGLVASVFSGAGFARSTDNRRYAAPVNATVAPAGGTSSLVLRPGAVRKAYLSRVHSWHARTDLEQPRNRPSAIEHCYPWSAVSLSRLLQLSTQLDVMFVRAMLALSAGLVTSFCKLEEV